MYPSFDIVVGLAWLKALDNSERPITGKYCR
jgi:hypothetical protein